MASTSTSANEILERRIATEDDGTIASLAAKLQEEHRLVSPKCCIFKVPARLREVNEKAYIPRAVSFGPFHRKKMKQYEAMEKHKVHYLKQFLRRRPSMTLKDCVRMLKRLEEEARGCYADDINLRSDEFVEMMTLDGCFIVELILREWAPELREQYDPLFDNLYIVNVVADLLLLENQLPFFVLDALFELINTVSDSEKLWEISFRKLALRFIEGFGGSSTPRDEPAHLLDLMYQMHIPSNRADRKKRSSWAIPRATQLREAGVKFRAAPEGRNLLDIKFEKGILEIPEFKVHGNSEVVFRNMIAYEQCYKDIPSFIVDYFSFMDDLIDAPSDVEFLQNEGIITSLFGDDEKLSNLVNNITKNALANMENFQYSYLYEELNRYYEIPWHKWKAKLKHDYFNTPWSIIASAAAAIVVICTIIQTVCTIIPTVK